MSHRNARESLIGARNYPAAVLSQHRRGHSMNLAGANNRTHPVSDESHLDLFSKNRRSLSVTSSDESSDVSVKLGRLSVGSAKLSRNGIDDLLSADGGKHDYDWLLTPPGTPTMFQSSEGNEPQRAVAAPRGSSLARSASTTKASRLSVSHSENNHPSRPARSSSVTRSSTSNSMYSAYSSNRSSTILNTSSASVSSYTRPSSPMTRSSSSTTGRPSTPSSRPSLSRPTTPSRARPAPVSSQSERPRTGHQQSSRPSTPSSRPQIPANLAPRTTSRPSTPTRRSSIPSLSPASSPSLSASSRAMSSSTNGRTSRPSSPSPRLRPLPHPVVPPDFPLDTPPNLRTSLPPDRPVSAGRSRPGAASSVTPRGHSEPSTAAAPRRHSSPIVARGRVTAPEPAGRARLHSDHHEPRKSGPDVSMRRPVKSGPALTASTDASGFGRNISKKSLDMAIRHMDIRNGGSVRQLSGTTLFPQSIRSAAPKSHSIRGSNSLNAANGGLQASYNGLVLENGNGNGNRNGIVHRPGGIENGADQDRRNGAKLSEVDIYESSRYDAIFLKEDLKNANWLHSIDGQTDSGSMFDHGFESLPEPFGHL